jgi:signal transduction histidine kinase
VLGGRPSRADLVIAGVAMTVDLAIFSDLVLALPGRQHSARWLVVAYGLLGAGVLAWRRHRPLAVLALLSLHAVLASLVLTYRPVVLICVALEALAARSNRRSVVAGMAISGCTVLGWVANEWRTSPVALSGSETAMVGAVYLSIVLGAAGIGGWHRAGLLERSELRRKSVEDSRSAVAEERRRLARELHDIVGHTVTVMMLQAAGARKVMAHDLNRADEALAAVGELGVQATHELRRLLGLLRADAPSTEHEPKVSDAPGLAGLAALLESVRAAGVPVELTERGHRRRLDPSVDLTCYRLVQEALTNTGKYARPGSTVSVQLEWATDNLTVVVEDSAIGDGPGTPQAPRPAIADPGGGHGLLGLGERVAAVGGTLHTGPLPTGGWRVAATLPCPAARRATDDEVEQPDAGRLTTAGSPIPSVTIAPGPPSRFGRRRRLPGSGPAPRVS